MKAWGITVAALFCVVIAIVWIGLGPNTNNDEVAGPASTGDADAVMLAFSGRYYRLEMAGSDWSVDVTINGFPVVMNWQANGHRGMPFMFVRDGNNVLHVRATQMGHSFPLELDLLVGEFSAPHQGFEKAGSVTADIGEIGQVVDREIAFEADVDGEWVWETAPPVQSLSEEDREEILGVARSLRDAFVAKDIEACADIRRIGYQETSRYLGCTPEEA